jgi:uncharacterized CHY-type Zn-finger protein
MKTAYRNKKILQLAKGQPCLHCGNEDGTTVAAHSNLQRDGKGVGLKSWDCFVAYLCYYCHTRYDTHTISQTDFDIAIVKTMKIWIGKI